MTTSRLSAIQQLLQASAAGEASAFAGFTPWTMTRDQLLGTRLAGMPLVFVAAAKKSCCSSAAPVPPSALLVGLRGEQPFDGSQFPRLPWGRPAMTPEDIGLLADWIAEGAPDDSPSSHEDLAFTLGEPTEDVQIVEASIAEAANNAFAEFDGNQYRYQQGELRQRMNIDCMMPAQLARLREAFEQLYALNDWPEDIRNYNNVALIHQNHCQHGWERFLPWHRIYLYEMEQVLQEFCPDVTMPYWDFTMPQYMPSTPDKGQILPLSFQCFLTEASLVYLESQGIPTAALKPLVGQHFPNQTTFFNAVQKATGVDYRKSPGRERFLDALLESNPLWYPLRYAGQFTKGTINNTIHYHYPTANDIAQILSLRTFRDFGGGSSYDDSFGFLDQNPHNTMHIWTGGMNPDSPANQPATANRNQSVQVAGRRPHQKSDLYSQPAVGDMFSNLTASYDPVFWPIHANIDRLWHEWQQLNPNSNPVELDSVLTPWSYTVRDTLEMKRFGYEYVRSSCLIPVGAHSPVSRFVSRPIDVTPKFKTAEVRLHRVPQLTRSCFIRVFLNLPDANANTPLDHPNYAGYFAIFGHGDCIGGPGHCAVPVRGRYDLRPRSHNTPRNHRVDVTACARRLFDATPTLSALSLTLVVVGADYAEDRELFRVDGVSLNLLD